MTLQFLETKGVVPVRLCPQTRREPAPIPAGTKAREVRWPWRQPSALQDAASWYLKFIPRSLSFPCRSLLFFPTRFLVPVRAPLQRTARSHPEPTFTGSPSTTQACQVHAHLSLLEGKHGADLKVTPIWAGHPKRGLRQTKCVTGEGRTQKAPG